MNRYDGWTDEGTKKNGWRNGKIHEEIHVYVQSTCRINV